MSLAKQLFLLISLLFLLIFAVNYVTGVNNIRGYLQTEAQIHAQDTATSLGVSLQPYIEAQNDTSLPTLINAVFDRGYYGKIILMDTAGKIIVERENPETFRIVPKWFSQLMPLQTAVAETEINRGWNIAANLSVSVHPGYAYLKLWDQAKRALLYSSAAYILSLLLLAVMLRMVLKPLALIESQAKEIGDGTFTEIDPLPWTKEIRSVAVAMNLMSEKIRQVIFSLQNRLGEAERELHTDSVTGLETRSSFDSALKQLFVSGSGGFLFLIQIDKLGEYAQSNSREGVDTFLKNFSSCIQDATAEYKDNLIFRLGGSEFALIAKSIDRNQAEQLCRGLSDGFEEFGRVSGKPGIAHIGGVAFDPLGNSQSLMSAALESYNKARLVGLNSFVVGEAGTTTYSSDQWVEFVKQSIRGEQTQIVISDSAESLSADHPGQILLEEITARVFDNDQNVLSIGTFISVAEELKLVTSFDRIILSKVINRLRSAESVHDVAVNLSFASIADPDFRSQLYSLLDENKDCAHRTVFCLTAYGAAKDLKLLLSFKELVHRLGAKLMIKRYEPRFMELETLKDFNFHYIRLARNLTENLDGDQQKRRLITTMVETGNLLGTTILAENVTDSDWNIIEDLGVHGASRRPQNTL